MNQTFDEHERQMECAEAEERLEKGLFASEYLTRYFGLDYTLKVYKRLGIDGCYDIACAISEVET